MGLHLNFDLRLPGSAPAERVLELLERLRAFAQRTAARRVSSIYSTRTEWDGSQPGADRLEGFFHLWAEILSKPWRDESDPEIEVDPLSALGFVILPGKGSEAATVGFIRRRFPDTGAEEWHWSTHCKTQYASIVSDEHLVRCHSALVEILDHAIALGIEVDVHDETGYWESRDPAVLLASVQRMNHLVAKFAGQLSDALPVKIEAPIFEHPGFEHLEMGE